MTQGETSPGAGDCLTGATLDQGDIVYMDWPDLIDGGAFDAAELPLGSGTFSPLVAVQAPATSAALQQLFGYDAGGGAIGAIYFTIVGTLAANTIDFGVSSDLTGDEVVAPWLDPPQPVQDGTDTIDSAVDGRPTDALWQADRLVTVSTYPCGTGPRDCVRVTELGTAGVTDTVPPTVNQDFLVQESGKDLFTGGIGLAGNGTLHVAWTRSSASDDPSSFAAHQSIGDAANSISPAELLAAGTGPYTGERWGDYVGVAQDPQVPNQAWNANEYSVGANGWATNVARLQTAGTTYVPITPVRVLNTKASVGLPGPFTANAPRSWQVTNGTTIPDEAVAVTGNLAVTGQNSGGYVAVTVTPTSTPPSSSINFPNGETRANNVTIPLSSAGKLSAVFKAGAGKKTHLVFDVTGYFLADDSGATFSPLAAPVRVLNTGSGVGGLSKFVSGTPQTLVIGDGGASGVPTTAIAVTGNLAIVKPTKAGYASVTKDPTAMPATSTINVPAGSVRANGVFAPLDANHALSIVYNASAGATANVVLDITGYFEPGIGGLRFVPLPPPGSWTAGRGSSCPGWPASSARACPEACRSRDTGACRWTPRWSLATSR